MAYVPVNINVYTAAFAGAMAGINVPSGAFITDPNTADYAAQTGVAAAFAAAVDTAWGGIVIANTYDIAAIEGASSNTFVRGAGNPFNAALTSPANWTRVANALVAMVLQGDVNATAQGIVLPPIPTGGGGALNPVQDQRYYVSKAGSNVTGTGSSSAPFLTIAAAMAAITDASPIKRYDVVVGPGTFADDFNLKPNVFVQGVNNRTTFVTPTTCVLDPTWGANQNDHGGFCDIGAFTAQTFDFNSVGDIGSRQGKLFYVNCEIDGRQTFAAKTNINQVLFQNCLLLGGYTQEGMNITSANSAFQNKQDILMNGTPRALTLLTAFGGGLDGNLTLTDPGGGAQVVGIDIYSFGIGGLITFNGALAQIAPDSSQRTRLGTGSPEGVLDGNVGDLYTNLSGGAGTTLYVKESGAGTNTGWVAK